MQKFWIVQVLNCIGFKIVSETTVDIWKAWIKNLSLTSTKKLFFCCNYLIATIVIFEVFFFFFGRKSGNFGVLMSKKSGANVPQNILVLCALHSGYSAGKYNHIPKVHRMTRLSMSFLTCSSSTRGRG